MTAWTRLVEYPGYAAAFLLAFGVIAKFVRDMYRWARNMDESLRYVRHEMELNSGKTMRDAIERIEGALIDASASRGRLGERLERIEETVNEQEKPHGP